MIHYKKKHIEFYGIDQYDFIPSQISGKPAVDFHHIDGRSNEAWNTIRVTREEHLKYGDKKKWTSWLKEIVFRDMVHVLITKLLDGDFHRATEIIQGDEIEKPTDG